MIQKIFVIDETGVRELEIDTTKVNVSTLCYLRDVMFLPQNVPLSLFQLPEVPELNDHVLVGPNYLGSVYPFAPISEFISFKIETNSRIERGLLHGPIVVARSPYFIGGGCIGNDPKITLEELNNLFTPLDRLLPVEDF